MIHPKIRRISTTHAARLLLELETPQLSDEPPQRYHDRLSEAQGVLEVLTGCRWNFRGIVAQHWPHVGGRRLVECVVLPALGTAWLDLERCEWWWLP